MEDGSEPIASEEVLYRRIPASQPGWYDPQTNTVADLAFNPRPADTTGISLVRAKYATKHEAARGSSRHGYFVATLPAARLIEAGLNVVPSPQPNSQGHCELSDLTYDNRKSNRSRELMLRLASEMVIEVEGPFGAVETD